MDDRCTGAASIDAPRGKTHDPAAELVARRVERRLGDLIALPNVGVNLTELPPGAASFVLHRESKQDELIYVLSGRPTLVVGNAELVLRPGDCYGFKAQNGRAHRLINRSAEKAVYLEIGSRGAGGRAECPSVDRPPGEREAHA
jgi:uncharacterized cupin superfamily protein